MADKEKAAKTGQEKRVVFFENNSWYHRTKELRLTGIREARAITINIIKNC